MSVFIAMETNDWYLKKQKGKKEVGSNASSRNDQGQHAHMKLFVKSVNG